MQAIMNEMMQLLTGGITDLASGIGTGLQALVKGIFIDGTGTTESPYKLTVFGGIIIIFAGIALAVGLSRFVMNFVSSLGN